MQPSRSIAFMTLLLACVFSICAVIGAIILPTFLPNTSEILRYAQDDENYTLNATRSNPPSNTSTPVSLLFLGDIMLARGIEWHIGLNDLSYPLSEVAEYLSAPDLTIGNFEGTIRDEPNQEIDELVFDTTPEIAGMIAEAGIDIVSLSNNHSNNYGSAIVQYTRKTLAVLGITPFGDPYDSENHIAHVTINNLPITFIGFHAFAEEPESILAIIESEKTAGNFVIVFPHWGNEYETEPTVAQTEAAHLFIDAGADAIIGSHPHVIQSYENYRGVPIVYSLGNFLFDQDFSTETQQGLTLGFIIDNESITMSFVPVSVIKSRVTLMGADDASTVLAEHHLPAILKITRPTDQNTRAQQ